MKCSECRVNLVETAAFCHECGAKVRVRRADSRARLRKKRRRKKHAHAVSRGEIDDGWVASAADLHDDDREVSLWTGTFSAKGMVNYWIGAIIVSVVVVVSASMASIAPSTSPTVLGVIAAGWLVLVLLLAYRKLDVHYELTNQRLIHKSGIFNRITNRIEVIDIDDIIFEQGIIERIIGVGTIEIVSSDQTDPVIFLDGIDHVQQVAQLLDDARRKERIRRGLHIEAV